MAGNFDETSTTTMKHHGVGINSTGKYIVSGIPQIFTYGAPGVISADLAASWFEFDSLSREITIIVFANSDAAATATATISFDDGGRSSPTIINGLHTAPGTGGVIPGDGAANLPNSCVIPIGTTVTLPIRAAGIRIGHDAKVSVTVIATLTGLTGEDITKYPRLKGDGKMTLQPHRNV